MLNHQLIHPKINEVLGRAGQPFWQDESFDHWVRSSDELEKLIEYVECNPKWAGLAQSAEKWPWSSAAERQTTPTTEAPTTTVTTEPPTTAAPPPKSYLHHR